MKAEKNLNQININGTIVPIITLQTNTTTDHVFGIQGITAIIKSKNNNQTLRTIINNNKQIILECHNSMTKPVITNRTEKQYQKICQEYIDHYTNKLQTYPDKIRHKYIKPDHLGWAYQNNTITYNNYMRYMTEEQIQLTIYHELCHLHALKHHGTLKHDKHFYNILRKEYTEEEEYKILKN